MPNSKKLLDISDNTRREYLSWQKTEDVKCETEEILQTSPVFAMDVNHGKIALALETGCITNKRALDLMLASMCGRKKRRPHFPQVFSCSIFRKLQALYSFYLDNKDKYSPLFEIKEINNGWEYETTINEEEYSREYKEFILQHREIHNFWKDTAMTTKEYQKYLIGSLTDDKEKIAYIKEIVADGSDEEILLALNNVHQAILTENSQD
jgi:hypothetical protein